MRHLSLSGGLSVSGSGGLSATVEPPGLASGLSENLPPLRNRSGAGRAALGLSHSWASASLPSPIFDLLTGSGSESSQGRWHSGDMPEGLDRYVPGSGSGSRSGGRLPIVESLVAYVEGLGAGDRQEALSVPVYKVWTGAQGVDGC